MILVPANNMPTQHFFAGSQYLGSRQVPAALYIKGQLSELTNDAFCCPSCGEVWARVTYDDPRPWYFRHRSCRRCAEGNDSGLLSDPGHWQASPLEFTPDWPEGAVRWEFQSLLSIFERNSDHGIFESRN
ncbi:MAG: putative zinc-ribbon protein [Siphoviridae sp. ctdEk19]|nr:MAG: putative zinc-ribbon protein [Siphoviridae sp. ctdEk19]